MGEFNKIRGTLTSRGNPPVALTGTSAILVMGKPAPDASAKEGPEQWSTTIEWAVESPADLAQLLYSVFCWASEKYPNSVEHALARWAEKNGMMVERPGAEGQPGIAVFRSRESMFSPASPEDVDRAIDVLNRLNGEVPEEGNGPDEKH
jgi:hypothetical protein